MKLFTKGRERIDALEEQFASLIATPALDKVEERAWTMDSMPVEQRREVGDDHVLRVVTGAVEMRITETFSKVFEDAEGRAGYARLLDTVIQSATGVEWRFDKDLALPMHHHAWSETIVVARGRWLVLVEDSKGTPQRYVLGPGMSISVPPHRLHSGISLDDSEIVTLSVPPLRGGSRN